MRKGSRFELENIVNGKQNELSVQVFTASGQKRNTIRQEEHSHDCGAEGSCFHCSLVTKTAQPSTIKGETVTKTATNNYKAKTRIANFTAISLQTDNILACNLDKGAELVDTLRKHADLPYVYVVSASQEQQISELLGLLKNIRSSCYPYALFVMEGDAFAEGYPGIDIIRLNSADQEAILASINRYADTKFSFDKKRLSSSNFDPLPDTVDVLIIGGGITGLYAANRLAEKQISFCLLEQRDIVGGIWSKYANTTSQVNTSEGAYRLIEKESRNNRDHSSTAEILEDLYQLSVNISSYLFTQAQAEKIERSNTIYRTRVLRNGEISVITSKGIILAINDRVGSPRNMIWENQHLFKGNLIRGISDEAREIDWRGKNVVIIGMGAFAVENARTALENGAHHVSLVCRRHGTVCPKIIDYLNFATPYDEKFQHDRKSNIRNMMLWKKLYDLSNATQPECWMGKIKHEGHTISVSDIWFIAHYLKKLDTVTGSVTGMFEQGVIVNHDQRIEADIVVNCVGFHRNSPAAMSMCDYTEMYNNNYIDKDFMYLADAYIDDDVFNSFFGSSVLEMTKFYMDVFIDFFDSPEFDTMIRSEGIEKISLKDRRWSHYIAGAEALIRTYPRFYEKARLQIDQRTANFLESHDLETYIAQNKREWIETHELLAGQPVVEADCLPYVFEKLIEKKVA